MAVCLYFPFSYLHNVTQFASSHVFVGKILVLSLPVSFTRGRTGWEKLAQWCICDYNTQQLWKIIKLTERQMAWERIKLATLETSITVHYVRSFPLITMLVPKLESKLQQTLHFIHLPFVNIWFLFCVWDLTFHCLILIHFFPLCAIIWNTYIFTLM